jgi:hypothetical protein
MAKAQRAPLRSAVRGSVRGPLEESYTGGDKPGLLVKRMGSRPMWRMCPKFNSASISVRASSENHGGQFQMRILPGSENSPDGQERLWAVLPLRKLRARVARRSHHRRPEKAKAFGEWFSPCPDKGPRRPHLVSGPRGSRHNSRAGHPASTPPRTKRAAGAPGWRRCSSLKYSRYSRSSRLAIRAPRSGTYATIHAVRTRALQPY